ncbi:hypothetical protein Q8G41_27395, partial [Klebsiella pneumoniae]|uniref:hypothetical protein n=1 Tax=Klebsiella pneumoniae TaxID=573 RepID=UPI003013881F
PVYAIGFGNSDEIDATALGRISTKSSMTDDPEILKRQFTMARTLLNNRIRAIVEAPWSDRASLAGKSLAFEAELRLADGETLRSGEVLWSTP